MELLRSSLVDLNSQNVALKQKLDIQMRRKELVSSRTEFQRVLDAVQKHCFMWSRNCQSKGLIPIGG